MTFEALKTGFEALESDFKALELGFRRVTTVSGDFVTVQGETHGIVDLERARRGSRQTQAMGLSKPTTALRVWS
jgi:hypothetical protein